MYQQRQPGFRWWFAGWHTHGQKVHRHGSVEVSCRKDQRGQQIPGVMGESYALQRVWWHDTACLSTVQLCICKIGSCFGSGIEHWGQVSAAHGERQGHSNELVFLIIAGHHDSQLESIVSGQEDLVEAIG